MAVFEASLYQSHLQPSYIRIGLTRAYKARVTEWRDIHAHLVGSLTHALLNQSTNSRLLKIGNDFFDVCDEVISVDYSRRKRNTFFLRYLEFKTDNVIDILIDFDYGALRL